MNVEENILKIIQFQGNYLEAKPELKKLQNNKLKLKKITKWVSIIISLVLLIIIITEFIIRIISTNSPKDIIIINKMENIQTNEIIDNFQIPQYMKEKGPLEMQDEYKIKTDKKEL